MHIYVQADTIGVKTIGKDSTSKAQFIDLGGFELLLHPGAISLHPESRPSLHP